jgi:DNA-binding MarR family transcriptional regulator
VKHRNDALNASRRRKDVAWRLNSVTVHLGRALRESRGLRDSARRGLAAEQRSALAVVAFMGPIPIGDLAQAERVGAPAMTKTVKILEATGLVRREADSGDGRRVRVRATAAGIRMVRAGRDERVAKIRKAIGTLTSADRVRLAAALDVLERVVGRIGEGQR